MAHKPYGLNELREMFLSFFETKGHLRLPSFSLVPQHDKSILLINAGMTPMKTYFTGEEEPPRRRICTCQKCIRTGDIENIGKTARHGTYFEMLGNFSFGDYFKREALKWSWEFLTSPDWVGLEPDRLYPSIYVDDDEAFEIWNKEIGIPAERIFRFGKEDNFWEHGSGPCGPCSEIYYDRGPEYGCGKPDCTVGCDCDRYIEVWNNVFSQFNNDGKGNYTELVQKNIDTGMGLERLACVCQNVDSLFDVDTVMNITNKVSEITGAHYGQSHKIDVSLRIITDHIRSATFMIGDGILPSNEGRGYVLRRLLRRAARHGKLLGVNDPFLYMVVDTVARENEQHYPDIREKQEYITKVIRTEEENFGRTIDAGMKIYDEMLGEHKKKGETVFSGDDAFKLYDTYGFPIDLTIEMAEEEGMTVDQDTFDKNMRDQKERAREARKALGDLAWAGIDLGLDDNHPTEFTGYDRTSDTCKVIAIVTDGEVSSAASEGNEAIVVLDKTPLYAEMGGQVADHGLFTDGDMVFEVTNVQKDKAGKYLHYGVVKSGTISVDQTVKAEIDTERRAAVARAHSATHLLQSALRTVLGDHVQQAGSLVDPDHLRFDFTHFSAITPDELSKIEKLVSLWTLEDMEITTEEMTVDQAKKMGATALFGEKYGETVRVVTMGDKSMELCGGTHLKNTAKIGIFKILSESSIASGVRRIEAITGMAVLEKFEETNKNISAAASILKTSAADLADKIEGQVKEIRELKQTIEKMKDRQFASDVESLIASGEDVGGVKVATAKYSNIEVGDLRKIGDFLRDKEKNIVAVIGAANGEKVSLLASCGKEAVTMGIKAGDVIKNIAPIVGGKGGGKPDSAMGGGSDVSKIDEALSAVSAFVKDNIKA